MSTSPNHIQIYGNNFEAAKPAVKLADQTLKVISFSGTLITAALPPDIAPGTYSLSVSFGNGIHDNAVFEVTIGALGPQGPAGPQGTQGPVGPTGASGQQGPQGPTGPPGPKGDTGATGAIGPQGQQGTAGSQGATGAAGPQGPEGAPGLTNRGNWNSGTPYSVDDAVSDNGQFWLALAVNTDSEPSPSNPNWQLLAAQGSEGLQGATGPAGATGAQGPAGSVGPVGPQGPQGLTGPAGPPGPTPDLSNYARLDIANTFASNQSINGNVVIAGNLGVGTTSPNPSYNLDVGTGTVNASTFRSSEDTSVVLRSGLTNTVSPPGTSHSVTLIGGDGGNVHGFIFDGTGANLTVQGAAVFGGGFGAMNGGGILLTAGNSAIGEPGA
ncbi:MAG: hypothetical protein ACREAC_09085, partial [Blastocatellia bacterium]